MRRFHCWPRVGVGLPPRRRTSFGRTRVVVLHAPTHFSIVITTWWLGRDAAGGGTIAARACTSGETGTRIRPRVGRSRSKVTSKMTMTSPAAIITANTPRRPTVASAKPGRPGRWRLGDFKHEDWRRHPVAEAVDPTGLGVEHLVQALDMTEAARPGVETTAPGLDRERGPSPGLLHHTPPASTTTSRRNGRLPRSARSAPRRKRRPGRRLSRCATPRSASRRLSSRSPAMAGPASTRGVTDPQHVGSAPAKLHRRGRCRVRRRCGYGQGPDHDRPSRET